MEQKTITAKIGYLFFAAVEKEKLNALKGTADGELPEQHENAALPDREGLPPVLAEIRTGENFLYGGGLTFPCTRYLRQEREFQVKGFHPYDSHALLTLYHDSGICQAGLHFTVQVDSAEDLIYLRQIFLSGVPVTEDGRSISQVADDLLKPLNVTVQEAENAYLLEINDFFGVEDPEEILCSYAGDLYGVMTGDEGHSYIPESLAKERLGNRWASRDFFSAVAFRNNFLLLNLSGRSRAAAYRTHQDGFGRAFWGGPNPYFFMDAPTACVNHGLYFAAETGMVAKTICANVLNRHSNLSHASHRKVNQSIQTTKELRRDLIITLNRLESIGMAELGELERLIMAGLEIDPMVEKIKYLLELLESELDLLYQTSTNMLVNVLTVVGLLLSAVQVIMGFL